MDRSTEIAVFGAAISVISLSISVAAFWFTWLRRGRLAMTRPTLVFFGYDDRPRLTPKIFLRTLLYSTSARGQVIEAMYVKVCRGGTEQTFSFWGYGEANNISPGSGLFVGQTGIAANHHFVLSAHQTSYEFIEGKYSITVFARVVGKAAPVKLDTVTLSLEKREAGVLAGYLGILFELGWDTGTYIGHSREYILPGGEGGHPE